MQNDVKQELIVTTYKCEECDKEFCELWIWCKGENIEKD